MTRKPFYKIGWNLLPLVVFLSLWEIAARFGVVSTTKLFPPFSAVAAEAYSLFANGIMSQNLFSTVVRVVIGLSIGSISGAMIGIVMGWSYQTNRSLVPIISILYPIPPLGWLPLLMIWIGTDEALPIAIITISSFFPVCYSTAAGIRNVDQGIIKAALVLGASNTRTLFEVVLPSAAPHVIAGLKLSSGMAWRTVIAAEMIAIPTGLGALLMKAEGLVRVDIIMACLLVLALMCLAFECALNLIEKKVLENWNTNAPH